MGPMPDYGRFCPVALGSEVLADRWTPLILRELILGNTRFNDIARGLPGISRSLLVQRLRHLERKGVVELWPSPTGRGNEYHLTPAGKDLEAVVDALGRWAVEWLFDELDPHEVDAVTLTWWMHRRVDEERLPPGRVVIEFDHTAPKRLAIWIVLDRGEAVGVRAAPRLRSRRGRDDDDARAGRGVRGLQHVGPGRLDRRHPRRRPAPSW